MTRTIRTLFFSPTHSSRKIALAIADTLAAALGAKKEVHDVTLPEGRVQSKPCGPDDALVLAFPVYGGRVPQVLEALLADLEGQGACAVVVAVYGNRHYDDALLEAGDLLTRRGFKVIAAAAFIAEHSLTPKVGTGRPDDADMQRVADFARAAAEKIARGNPAPVTVKGQRPYKERGPTAPVSPKTGEGCTECMLCVASCPMGVISAHNPRLVSQGCICCFACVKSCPEGIKYFDDERIAQIRAMLESKCGARKEPELFL
ncbi:4Fe-4S ferredoxin [Desulfovibrio sp. ZJ200]|uniref:flavodoxin family protein n=1 Tax=Desulfovibrio sp. ZJ200 TaxID=2709792 RepID=UPI0013ED7547|nr:4Fe-4S ferredoxin [Desulfovibrio sp. ZJ200]